MNNRLILVEGIPGVGKTTTARNIKKHLDEKNIKSKLFLEGNLEHPADYESVAYLDEKEFNDLINKYNINEKIISEYVSHENTDYFIYYGMMRSNKIYIENKGFYKQLMSNDVYALPNEKYTEVITKKWKSFVSTSEKSDYIYIFECCFLQNPLTTMMAHHNMSSAFIKEHIRNISEIIKPLNPLIIFLDTKDVKKNFNFVKKNRSIEWYNFVEDYVTNQEYGNEHSLKGYDGLITFYSHLKDVALESYETLDFIKIKLENSRANWKTNKEIIEDFISSHLK